MVDLLDGIGIVLQLLVYLVVYIVQNQFLWIDSIILIEEYYINIDWFLICVDISWYNFFYSVLNDKLIGGNVWEY